MEKLHRHGLDRDLGEPAPTPVLGTPGKVTLTSRLYRRAAPGRDDNGVAAGAEAEVERAASSAGAPLPGDLREKFGASLGADLSSVRVHTGAESAAAASAVGAKAYAVGQDIHFAEGQYDPSSQEGIFLIAHEVAHTVQQAGATPAPQHKLEVSTPGDAAEVEADRAAEAMVGGERALVTSGGTPLARNPDADQGKDKDKSKWWRGFKFTVKPPALGKEGQSISVGISDAGELSGSGTIASKLEEKLGGSLQWQLGPAVANLGMSGSAGLQLTGSLSASGKIVEHENPDEDFLEATIKISGFKELYAAGKLLLGGGVGAANFMSATLNGFVGLKASAKQEVGLSGTLRIAKSGVTGTLALPIDMRVALDGNGGLMLIANTFGKDHELYELELAKWPVAEMMIKGDPGVTFPGPTASGSVEMQEPRINPPPTAQKIELAGPLARKARELDFQVKQTVAQAVAEAEEQTRPQMSMPEQPGECNPDNQHTPDKPAAAPGPGASSTAEAGGD